MTYFRMQLLSHGTGPLAPGRVAMPLPGVTSLSATPARRRPAVKVQPPRAYLRAARYLPGQASGRERPRWITWPARRRPTLLAGSGAVYARQAGRSRLGVAPSRSGDGIGCPVRVAGRREPRKGRVAAGSRVRRTGPGGFMAAAGPGSPVAHSTQAGPGHPAPAGRVSRERRWLSCPSPLSAAGHHTQTVVRHRNCNLPSGQARGITYAG